MTGPHFTKGAFCRESWLAKAGSELPGEADLSPACGSHATDFFTAVAVSTTFVIELARARVEHIVPLIIGGALAAPFGGYMVGHAHQIIRGMRAIKSPSLNASMRSVTFPPLR